MTRIDLTALRTLAEAAAPGPWAIEPHPYGNSPARSIHVADRDADEFPVVNQLGCACCDFGLDADAEDLAYIAALNPATVLRLLDALEGVLDAADERDRLRIWQERVALAAGIADEVEGRGVHLEADPDIAAEHMAGLLSVADTHVECPVYCDGCGETLADTWCDHCHGSGCGPGTATGAYEECEWCAGSGKVHVGCASRSYADLAAERDTLATSVERVRALAVEYEEQALREGYGGELWSTTAAAIRRALDAATDTGDMA